MKTTDFPVAINMPRSLKLRGGAIHSGDDISQIRIESPITMVAVWYHSPHRIHGILDLDKNGIHYFVGYKCTECNEVFLVLDTVKEFNDLSAAMQHKCMEAR